MKQPKSKLYMSSLDEPIEYSALLVELCYGYILASEAVSPEGGLTIKYCTKYYMAILI